MADEDRYIEARQIDDGRAYENNHQTATQVSAKHHTRDENWVQ